MEPDQTGSLSLVLAPTACVSCKERKQKCDRQVPRCSRCDRLLLKCSYTSPAWLSSALLSADEYSNRTSANHSHEDSEVPLVQGLTSAVSKCNACAYQVSILLRDHKKQLEDLLETFFNTHFKWVPIIDQQSFWQRWNASTPGTTRGFTALVLSMCLITQPSIERGKPRSLGDALYLALKCLFWNPESIAQPTLTLVQCGVLLSSYEYAQGMLEAAYMTICTCSSMARVCQPPVIQSKLRLPPISGPWRPEHESLRTGWGVLIHERMICLKNGVPIRPMDIRIPNPDVSDDGTLRLESDVIIPSEVRNPLFASFYLEARAGILLDQVLDLVHNSDIISQVGRLRFQALDRSLLLSMRHIIQLGLSSCCEAVAITLSAFIHLHRWRLDSLVPILSSTQDQLESLNAIDTVAKMLSDIAFYDAENVVLVNALDGRINICQSPYSVHMIYLILAHILKLQQNEISSFLAESKMLWALLEKQEWRWKIAGDYIAVLSH